MSAASTSPVGGKHVKVTRRDWVDAALAALDTTPIDELRVLTLAQDLSVSRSSFYWYFETPAALTDELLARWEINTTSIVERANRPASNVVLACLGVFECWADARLYHAGLDLAVREWGRREPEVGAEVSRADDRRLRALTSMFEAHAFDGDEALVRARLLYHSQLGYYALATDEPMETRLQYLPYYIESMAGRRPTDDEIASFVVVVDEAGSALVDGSR